MKLIYISNRFTNHQVELCNEFNKLVESFMFVETELTSARKLQNGKTVEGNMPSYVIPSEKIPEVQPLIDCADVVIFGSAPDQIVKNRLKKGLLTFKYSERIYKKGIPWLELPLRYIRYNRRFNRFSNYYLLCSSAYSAYDYSLTRNFVNRTFKWGYFPKTTGLSFDEIYRKKNWGTKLRLLWVGRFIDWKHPEKAVEVADCLRNIGLDFSLSMLGTGPMESEIQNLVVSLDLQDKVSIVGSVPSREVRDYMDKSHIFIYTSDYNEGWGAVLNEALGSGCVVVASHAIGSVPYLLKDEQNGFIYDNDDDKSLVDCILKVVDKRNQWPIISQFAYKTISEEWNASIAACRFVKLASMLTGSDCFSLENEGPCSKAKIVKNRWIQYEQK